MSSAKYLIQKIAQLDRVKMTDLTTELKNYRGWKRLHKVIESNPSAKAVSYNRLHR